MHAETRDVWEAMSTARTIRRFTDEPVDDATLAAACEAATLGAVGCQRAGVAVRRVAVGEQRAVVARPPRTRWR